MAATARTTGCSYALTWGRGGAGASDVVDVGAGSFVGFNVDVDVDGTGNEGTEVGSGVGSGMDVAAEVGW